MILAIAVSGLMVLANAVFVAAEFSSVSARRARVARLADAGSAPAAALARIVASPRRLDTYVAACQVGITAVSLVLGLYAQREITSRLATRLGASAVASEAMAGLAAGVGVLVVLTGALIVVGELVPKAIALRDPERIAVLTSLPMRALTRLFAPFIWLLNGTAGLLLRALGVESGPAHSRLHSPAEIKMLIDETSRAGLLDVEERQMLDNAFDLSGLVARQVMIPRTRLSLADITTPTARLLADLARSPYSRIPIYRGSPDDIVGIVHLKDLFRLSRAGVASIEGAIRPVPLVPETMGVGRLWLLLNQQRTYVAIVLDEQGGTAGMVTQEDLLEEIVGEVQDEFDSEAPPIAMEDGGRAVVRGDVLVADVNHYLGLDLPTEGADTIGGLVMDELGRLAVEGDAVDLAGARIEVIAVRRHWVASVAVTARPRAADE